MKLRQKRQKHRNAFRHKDREKDRPKLTQIEHVLGPRVDDFLYGSASFNLAFI